MPVRNRRENPPKAPQTELIIGLVGAVGIDLTAIVTSLKAVLSGFDYRCHDLHLTDLLRDLDWTDVPLIEEPLDERLDSYMTAGDKLRERWERDDAFGLLAISAITKRRSELSATSTDRDEQKLNPPLDRHAYIVRSFKRIEEANLLRDVYGDRFILLSIYSPKDARHKYLRRRIRESRVVPHDSQPKYKANDLIERDEKEAVAHGQDVRGIFHKGDFFIDATEDLKEQMQRTMEILFGHPRRTPTRDEFGMFQAVATARRSAELGRQVGAAICTAQGDVVAVGTNEVPKFGGGLYWEGDPCDAREFTKRRDTSDHRKSKIAKRIVKHMADLKLLARHADNAAVEALILESEFGDLIEYYRAVHAEMAAVTDAARRGIALQDDVL